jgi:DNA processing protein
VDRKAHKGALEAGGATIAVLPEGVNHLRLTEELRPLADPEKNFLAISMFEPDEVWKTWRAMERNKLIVGLSAGLFVIEARESGGTINAAYETIRQGKPLYAVAYTKDLPGREGNRKLLAGSAIPLRHMHDLKRALEEAMSRPPAGVRQLVMSLVGPGTEKRE